MISERETFVSFGSPEPARSSLSSVEQEFARRAQADDHDLLVASAFCHAHTGLGDPYLPFRELLTMLTGDVEACWVGGLISPQQAGRLWQAMPVTIPALIEKAPDSACCGRISDYSTS